MIASPSAPVAGTLWAASADSAPLQTLPQNVLEVTRSFASRCYSTCRSVSIPSLAVACLAASTRSRYWRSKRNDRGRTVVRAQGPPPPSGALPNTGYAPSVRKSTAEIEQARLREQMVEAALDMATPVPQDFDQAISYALNGLLKATKAKQFRQSYYFNTGDTSGDLSGELGNAFLFAERLTKLLAIADGMEDKVVRVVFADMGACAMAEGRWDPLPENMAVDYLPPLAPLSMNPAAKGRLIQLLQSDFIVVVAPSQEELWAIQQLFELMEEFDAVVPMALINPKLAPTRLGREDQNQMAPTYRSLMPTFCPVFHLEQLEGTDEDEGDLNPCVVSRVYPLPFSVWEDNPYDPDAVDGYFLLDMSNDRVRPKADIYKLLRMSRDFFRDRELEGDI
mmetsp:Transcript_57536/g.136867  ORF Transcript_57536/g.136867 Transcript_57536/m.136867 type:complete len:394 (-) Transcript_57536:64-1245(-)